MNWFRDLNLTREVSKSSIWKHTTSCDKGAFSSTRNFDDQYWVHIFTGLLFVCIMLRYTKKKLEDWSLTTKGVSHYEPTLTFHFECIFLTSIKLCVLAYTVLTKYNCFRSSRHFTRDYALCELHVGIILTLYAKMNFYKLYKSNQVWLIFWLQCIFLYFELILNHLSILHQVPNKEGSFVTLIYTRSTHVPQILHLNTNIRACAFSSRSKCWKEQNQ